MCIGVIRLFLFNLRNLVEADWVIFLYCSSGAGGVDRVLLEFVCLRLAKSISELNRRYHVSGVGEIRTSASYEGERVCFFCPRVMIFKQIIHTFSGMILSLEKVLSVEFNSE